MPDFKLYFAKRQQWVDVYLHDVTPGTFDRRGGGRWAYYEPTSGRTRSGLFGELHIVSSRVRVDVVAHELIHVLCDIMRLRGMNWTDRSEERIASLYDALVSAFWREYRKIE